MPPVVLCLQCAPIFFEDMPPCSFGAGYAPGHTVHIILYRLCFLSIYHCLSHLMHIHTSPGLIVNIISSSHNTAETYRRNCRLIILSQIMLYQLITLITFKHSFFTDTVLKESIIMIDCLLTGYNPPESAFPRITMSGRTSSWSTQRRLVQ